MKLGRQDDLLRSTVLCDDMVNITVKRRSSVCTKHTRVIKQQIFLTTAKIMQKLPQNVVPTEDMKRWWMEYFTPLTVVWYLRTAILYMWSCGSCYWRQQSSIVNSSQRLRTRFTSPEKSTSSSRCWKTLYQWIILLRMVKSVLPYPLMANLY